MAKRALISVFIKDGILDLAKFLINHSWEIISTGGTAAHLKQNNIPVTDVSSVTHFPECLDGRVKTLHPVVHAGLLARRDDPAHMYFSPKCRKDFRFQKRLSLLILAGQRCCVLLQKISRMCLF